MAASKKAYSLIELMVVVVVIGVLAVITVPRLNFGVMYRKQAHTVAEKITTDLRRTRAIAISAAATNPTGYTLRMTGSAPYSGYQIINDSNSATVDSQTVDSHVSCAGGSQFSFGYLGNLRTGSATQLTVSAEGKTYTITVIPGTGIVKCSN